MQKILVTALCAISLSAAAQPDHSHRLERSLKFPDIAGYNTMKCDFHEHTVFSDGSVWPDIRVMEALMDGLDAISLTEHLEYQPHKADIPHPDRNRSYELALKEAKDHDLIIVRGSEITRKMPPGHCNAIFIQDANKMLISDSVAIFREAKNQGGFVFWNHPNWIAQRKDGMATLTDFHRMLIKEKLLDGIEVANAGTYSDEALQIGLDNNLTLMGTSDIHTLIDWDHDVPHGGHRPITLVFAKQRTADAIKEGLVNRRTVVFYKDLLIGRDEFLLPLLQAAVQISSAKYVEKSNVLEVELENKTSATFTLFNKTGYTFHDHGELVTIAPGGKTTVQIKVINRLEAVELKFQVMNAVNAPHSHPDIIIKGKVTQ
ncbi:MAG TPA: Sb-PDE family phosphodiesterase [Chitinophagaceae bacterium]|nr:Sb-PDE family phosphodiesterase [Chitinophagaceae bacterium]